MTHRFIQFQTKQPYYTTDPITLVFGTNVKSAISQTLLSTNILISI